MAKAPYFPPPPPIPPKVRMFKRMPPAVFTPIMGMFGLGLAWRRAGDVLSAPAAVGEVVLGAVTMLYLFSIVAYVMKLIQNTDTFVEDLKVLPGRAGLTAMVLSGYLLAATLEPYAILGATSFLLLALLLHLFLAVRLIHLLVTGPAEARIVNPVWHLIFAGFVLIPLAAVPIGLTTLATVAFWVGMFSALVVWFSSAVQFSRRRIPAPLRPLLAIHLAPASVLGTGAYLLGEVQLAMIFCVAAIVILGILLGRVRWMIKAEFSPLWGAFTFPLAAFSGLLLMAGAVNRSDALKLVGGISLIAATLITLPIAYKIIQMWSSGVLAVKTNAAEA